MNRPDAHDDHGGWRELAEGLHGLRAEPPPTLAPAVLERVGLADAFVTVHGPAGPLLVAYNGRGISATAPGGDEAGFRERFQARFRRPLRPADQAPAKLVAQVGRVLDPGRAGHPPRYGCAPPGTIHHPGDQRFGAGYAEQRVDSQPVERRDAVRRADERESERRRRRSPGIAGRLA